MTRLSESEFKEELLRQRQQFLVKANGGIGFPAAGAMYWLALAIIGMSLSKGYWIMLAFYGSGIIFPLGILMGKVLKSNGMVKSPLTSVLFPTLIAMLLHWAFNIVALQVDPEMVPITLGIGMSLHWPVIGWMYNSKTCLGHAIIRAILVTVAWFLFPELRFTLIPMIIVGVYLLSIFGLKYEVGLAKKVLGIASA